MAASASKRPPDGNVRMQPLLFKALEADGSNTWSGVMMQKLTCVLRSWVAL